MAPVLDDTLISPRPYDIDGVCVWRHRTDPATLHYLPAAPVPELSSTGKPCLHLLITPAMGSLQIGAHFILRPDVEAALLARIGALDPTLTNAILQPAPLQVLKAVVVLADASGVETELGAAKSSAFPPFAVAFLLTLTPKQAARAILSITGERGILFVDYTVQTRDSDAPVTRRCDVAEWFLGNDGQTYIRILASPTPTTTQQETTDDR